MKKLKQLYCKHEYKFFSDTKVFPISSPYQVNGYKYVCYKCNKEITLVSTDLEKEIDELQESIRKKIVLGEDLSYLNNNSEFVMKVYENDIPILYSGKHIDALKKKYKSRGIDLNEITHWYSKNEITHWYRKKK